MAGDAEFDKCDFCREKKPIARKYIYPSKYIKPKDLIDRKKLYNDGDYFIIIRYCNDCGIPKI